MHYRYYSTKLQVFQEYLAPRRVLVPEQVGVAEKEKARRLALLQPVFYCYTRCGKHPFNSSAKIAEVTRTGIILACEVSRGETARL